jgi:arsenite methyltransferase
MATDISEEMLEWARKRVQREGVADRVEFRRADVLELPFEADRFDAVISESVLAFLEDKDRAIHEMTRVLKPGGWMGLNETCWLREPPAGLAQKADPSSALGTYILTGNEWHDVWNAAGLEEAEVRVGAVDAAEEVRSRLSWVGARQILRAWSRIIPMYFTRPAMRSVIKETLGTPREYYAFMGLALLAGRKPAPGN